MIKLHFEQLFAHLKKKINSVYLLFGNDPLLLQESYDLIRKISLNHGFKEHDTFHISSNTDWKEIFFLCKEKSLFTTHRILQILLPENGPNTIINNQLLILINLLHKDILLIIRGNRLTKKQTNSIWFDKISQYSVLVNCQTPKKENLPVWVIARAKKNQLQLDQSTCQLLCYYYEGNLLALSQILDHLSFLFPDKKLTLSRVKSILYDSSHFTPIHWIDSLLTGESKRALHILQQFQLEGIEPTILLRVVHHELLLLVSLKRCSTDSEKYTFLNKHYVIKNRYTLIMKALNRLNQDQLNQSIKILTLLELELKQNCKHLVWYKLAVLSLLLCYKSLGDTFIDD